MSDTIFIVGGNGYIGSHTNLLLLDKGYKTVVLDKQQPEYLVNLPGWIWEEADLQNLASLESVFLKYNPKAVIHFAASIEVAESQINPQKYYFNNVVGTLNLLKVMNDFGVQNLVFSSTAAVYGLPKHIPINENDQTKPINTYGKTKLVVENILEDYYHSYGLKSVILRYFNACGADHLGRSGECHEPESHLIPILLEVASGKRPEFGIYGDDYETLDGTCIRDYIHVEDLATAHLAALEGLLDEKLSFEKINLGTGSGFSVKEIVEKAKQITKKNIAIKISERRAGDPDKLIASNQKAKELLEWKPQKSDLDTIILSAWNWLNRK